MITPLTTIYSLALLNEEFVNRENLTSESVELMIKLFLSVILILEILTYLILIQDNNSIESGYQLEALHTFIAHENGSPRDFKNSY